MRIASFLLEVSLSELMGATRAGGANSEIAEIMEPTKPSKIMGTTETLQKPTPVSPFHHAMASPNPPFVAPHLGYLRGTAPGPLKKRRSGMS